MAAEHPSRHRYRCRCCGAVLPAWWPVAQEPNAAMLLHHLSTMHPTEAGPYLARLRTEDIATVAAEASEVVEELVWQALTAQHPATP